MTCSLLKNLLTLSDSPSPKIILIKGSVGTSYQLLVQYMVNQLLKQSTSCLYHVDASTFNKSSFCWSDFAQVQHFVSPFQNYGEDESALDGALRCINTRPGQDFGASQLSHLDTCAGGNDLQQLHDSNSAIETERPVLLLEGVEALLLRTSVRCLLAALRSTIQGRGVVLLVCGSPDSLPSASLTALEHAVPASIHLTNVQQPAHLHWQGVARLQLQRPGGKLLNSCEYYKLDETSVITSPCNLDRCSSASYDTPSTCLPAATCCGASPDCSLITGQQQTPTNAQFDHKEVDTILSSQTTFSLQLSEQERRDKNSLELPHHRARGAGLVLYTPDREDWDEDDPDDDLDI